MSEQGEKKVFEHFCRVIKFKAASLIDHFCAHHIAFAPEHIFSPDRLLLAKRCSSNEWRSCLIHKYSILCLISCHCFWSRGVQKNVWSLKNSVSLLESSHFFKSPDKGRLCLTMQKMHKKAYKAVSLKSGGAFCDITNLMRSTTTKKVKDLLLLHSWSLLTGQKHRLLLWNFHKVKSVRSSKAMKSPKSTDRVWLSVFSQSTMFLETSH